MTSIVLVLCLSYPVVFLTQIYLFDFGFRVAFGIVAVAVPFAAVAVVVRLAVAGIVVVVAGFVWACRFKGGGIVGIANSSTYSSCSKKFGDLKYSGTGSSMREIILYMDFFHDCSVSLPPCIARKNSRSVDSTTKRKFWGTCEGGGGEVQGKELAKDRGTAKFWALACVCVYMWVLAGSVCTCVWVWVFLVYSRHEQRALYVCIIPTYLKPLTTHSSHSLTITTLTGTGTTDRALCCCCGCCCYWSCPSCNWSIMSIIRIAPTWGRARLTMLSQKKNNREISHSSGSAYCCLFMSFVVWWLLHTSMWLLRL